MTICFAKSPDTAPSENISLVACARSFRSLLPATARCIPARAATGVFGLYLLAFCQIANTTAALVALLLMLLTALADGRRFVAALARSGVAWTTLILSLYVLLRAVTGAWQHPAVAGADYHSLTDWMILPLFPLVAWFSRGDSRRIRWLLTVALVGSLLGMALRSNWPAVAQAWSDSGRVHWGLPYISSALYLGTLLTGWLVFAENIAKPGRYFWSRTAGWLAVTALVGEMLLVTQSRAVLLSLIVIFPATALINLWRSTDSAARRRGLTMATGIMIAIAALAVANGGAIVARYHKTSETLAGMSTLHIKNIPKTSLGQRARLYKFGSQMWLQHPVWGWGPGFEATTMHAGAPRIPGTSQHYEHLHDGYLETLVRFGVVGLCLDALLAFFLARGFWRAWRSGDVPADIGLFLTFAWLLAALINVTDFRLTHKPFEFYNVLLLGLMYGYSLKPAALRPAAAGTDGDAHG